MELLRFCTCGSVDDGKSTLIGRLLFESKQVFEDQLSAATRDSKRYGTRGDEVDLALLVDGSQAEREQAITIDAAYRYFTTGERRFIVADLPGHAQYTRNMATGASTADVALLLIDAKKGIVEQTYRHSRIVALFGIRYVVVAVNKMDAVGWGRERFADIEAEYRDLAEQLAIPNIDAIPVSALVGDNVTAASDNMPWYSGPSLLDYLNTVDPPASRPDIGFRMPVQFVNRPRADFRGFCGRIASGTVRVGDVVCAYPDATPATISGVIVSKEQVPYAVAGQSVTLQLSTDIDAGRGCVLGAVEKPMLVCDRLSATVLCLSDPGIAVGDDYVLKVHTMQAIARVSRIRCRIDVTTGEPIEANCLVLNDIGEVEIEVNSSVPFEVYEQSRTLGSFLLISRIDNCTTAAGMIDLVPRHDAEPKRVDPLAAGAPRQMKQRAPCVWLTGLPASGKSTIARQVEAELSRLGQRAIVLDWSVVDDGLCRDLDTTDLDRDEATRRVAEVAKLMIDAGVAVVVSCDSPRRAGRDLARSLVGGATFTEVFVDTPLYECQRRRARGAHVTGGLGQAANTDWYYEPPTQPDLVLGPGVRTPEECAHSVLAHLSSRATAG